MSLPQIHPTRWQRVRAWVSRNRPFCWCFPPVVIAGIITAACLAITLVNLSTTWAIEARIETLVKQNERLTTENAKLRGQMADAIKAVRGE